MSKSNPDHYKFGKVEVLDITKYLPFPEGNVIKYLARAGRKESESSLDDLLKARKYLDTAIDLAIEAKAIARSEELSLIDEYCCIQQQVPDSITRAGKRKCQ